MLEHIIQGPHSLIGTQEAIEALAHKDNARILVVSDSHGRSDILEKIARRYGKDCDALIFCGDGIGDLAQLVSASKTNPAIIESMPAVVAFARGNGDPSSYPLDAKRSLAIPNTQILTVNEHNIMIVHGHREGVDFGMENLGLEMQLAGCTLGFYGHTHVAREENAGEFKFVNPGSCARPRDGQAGGFAIATIGKNFIDIAFLKAVPLSESSTGYKIWQPTY